MTPAPRANMTANNDDLTNAVGMLAIAAIGAAGVCWVAARTTVLLTTGSHAGMPFSRSPAFVIELLGSRSPARAWAHTYPDAPPLEVGLFWLVLGATILAAATLCAVGLTFWPQQRRATTADPARWATRRDERKIAVRRDPTTRRWRLTAGQGRQSRRLLAGNDCVSAVVFGPNGSGKTTSLIVPNVLDWDGPVVLTTAKPQDLEPICRARATRGRVWVIAPGGATDHPLAGWSPLEGIDNAETADRVAEWMVESSGMTADAKARPWNAQARKYLKGLLLAAAVSGGGITQWVEWIHAGERARDHVEDILHGAGHDATAREYSSTWQIHEEGKGSVLFTALGLADTYSRPGILTAAERGGFSPDELLTQGGTLCIVTPNAEGDRFAPYFTALLSAIIHQAETSAAARGGPLEPRLLLALDEAGNVFRYPRLPHLLTTARGNGIQLLLIYHDLAQVEHLYGGREVARTVMSNAKMRMLLPGVADLDTLRYWSDLIGHTRTETTGTTTGFDGKRSRSRNEHSDQLAPMHKLQQLAAGQAVLLYENLPPARVRLLPWYTDPRFRDLASRP
jgi:type IV secretion system protein VirD4